MKYTEVSMEQAITSPKINNGEVYMLVRLNGEMTLEQLWDADSFMVIEDDKFEKMEETVKEINENLEEMNTVKEVIDDIKGKKLGRPTTVDYDIGKIQALINAGWKTADIAAEFHTDTAKMSKYIYAQKAKGNLKGKE